jgi:hypothetical protein
MHPEPVLFSSPQTGRHYNVQYSRNAFEADLPRIEAGCNRTTGAGCTLIPTTDDGTPAAFYPFYNAFDKRDRDRRHGRDDRACVWAFGNHLPGASDFGRNSQYGTLLTSSYLVFGGGGTTQNLINNFRGVMPNPCPAAQHHRGPRR